MPKIQYLHKTRQGIPDIYAQMFGDILQNMNFSRYYRNRGKFIYGFDPNIIQYDYEFYIQKQKRKVYHDTAFCNFNSMFLDNHTVKNIKILICKGDYHVSQYSRNI